MNFQSDDWKEVVKAIDAEIAILDTANRSVKLGADETASIRGRIAGLIWLKEWPDRANQPIEQEVSFE